MQKQVVHEKYVSGLKLLNLTVDEALKDFLILNLSEKIAGFKSESSFFEKKYQTDIQSFQKRIQKKINAEDFDEDDDYLAWKFAEESKTYLQKKLEDILK
jgi:hypothetical protein